MKRVRFYREVHTVLRLSAAEVAELTKLCEDHYDGAVRGLSVPGPDAFLNTARGDLEWQAKDVDVKPEDKGFVEIRVTHRQLDTLCKATETMSSVFVTRDGNPALHEQLVRLLRESSVEWARSNPENEGNGHS